VTAKLLSYRDLAPTTRHFEFELPDRLEFRFVPGQFVSLKREFNGRELTRAYSLASAPNGNRFSLCLNRIDQGVFSNYLFTLEPGAELEVAEPIGYFTLKRPERPALFVATGTGVAPFRAMLQQHLTETTELRTLLLGCRHVEGLLYHDEFEALAGQHDHFSYLPTVTRPEGQWTGRTGRVQAHVEEALAGRTDVDVFICGLKEMVDDVRAQLKQKGFDRKQINYEKYD
jgi:CDP-4-dehydro-6-deoxyglucose reductase